MRRRPSSPPTSADGASSAACSRPARFVIAAKFIPDSLLAATAGDATTFRTAADTAALNPSVYLGIDPDGTVHIVTHRSEMGTGIRTSLPMVAADELDADWARVKIVQGIGDARYGDQNTDGSKSIRDFFDAFRQAGASARAMLVQAAAAQWGVPAAECTTGLHEVLHKASGRKAPYGSLVAAAAMLPVPKAEALTLKPRSAWRYIGKDRALYDLADIVHGKAVYGMDAKVDGMVHASIERPPVLGAVLKSFDEKAALAVKGVRQVVTLDPWKPPIGFQPLGGVAVIADSTWAAMQGRKQLKVEWDRRPRTRPTTRRASRKRCSPPSRSRARSPAAAVTSTPNSPKAARRSRPATTCRTTPTPRWSRRSPSPTSVTAWSPRGRRCRTRRRHRTPWPPRSASTRAT